MNDLLLLTIFNLGSILSDSILCPRQDNRFIVYAIIIIRYTCNNIAVFSFTSAIYILWGWGWLPKVFTRKISLRQIYQTQFMYKSNKNFSGISKNIFNVLKKGFYHFFSRPELNAQVGFSDSILYVVRHPVRL